MADGAIFTYRLHPFTDTAGGVTQEFDKWVNDEKFLSEFPTNDDKCLELKFSVQYFVGLYVFYV